MIIKVKVYLPIMKILTNIQNKAVVVMTVKPGVFSVY